MIRSLRWRLVLAMMLILGAAIAVAGVFSSVTVKREFDRFLVEQRSDHTPEAMDLIREGGVPAGLQRVYDELHIRTIVTDGAGKVIAAYPPEMRAFEVRIAGNTITLNRLRNGSYESLQLHGNARKLRGVGTVWLMPPGDGPGNPSLEFRGRVDRWLLAGLGAATLLAVLVMLTIFRRLFAPVEALTAGAQQIASGRLDARVDVRGRDEIAELARSFNSMAEALERNERARRNMVSDVAHELRTPLTNIRVQVEAVQDGVAAADAKFLGSIEEEVLNLSRLVDDLQQLSLAEAGQLRLEVADVAVAEIVDRALDGMTAPVTRDVAEGLVVRADSRRMVQVLRNLVVNAATYARSSIAVRAAREGEEIVIRVADDGPGVPPEHAERVFDRFHRADASRSRTTGGAGLGLAIARELVELHGGRIWLENRPGEGATFAFALRAA